MGISVGKAIKNIDKDGLQSNYFLLGNDSYLQKFFIKTVKEYFGYVVKVNYFDLNDEADIEILINDLQTVPMFSTKQIFAIRNFKNIKQKEQIFIEKYIQNPSPEYILFFIHNDYKINNNFHKNISKESLIVDIQTPFYNNKIKEWINYFLKINDYVLDYKIIDFLIENYSDDLSNIFSEIEKIYLYKKDKNIKFDNFDISYNNRHIKMWNLMDSLGNKELSDSINLFNKLLLNGVTLIPILINLTDFYSELLLDNPTNNYNGLNKIINARLKKYKQNYNVSEIMKILVQLRNIDIIFKSTSIKENLLFIPLVIKICKNHYEK